MSVMTTSPGLTSTLAPVHSSCKPFVSMLIRSPSFETTGLGAQRSDMAFRLPPRTAGAISAARASSLWIRATPATSHTAVLTQPDLLHAFIEPFLKGETPKGMFEDPGKP